MRIRTLLIVGTALSAGVMVAAAVYLFGAKESLDSSLAKDAVASKVSASVFLESELLADYLLHPGERARLQWGRKHAEIGALLDNIALSRGKDRSLPRMLTLHHRKKKIFVSLWALLERRREGTKGRNDGPAVPATSRELAEYRAAQVRLLSEGMFTLARQWRKQARLEMLQKLYGLAFGVAALISVVVLLLAAVWFVLGWRVVRPIGRLREGIREFKGGEVSAWKGIRLDDEIGDVAREFGHMAENLNRMMVSRDALSKEVETRRRAERKAQEYAESLKARTTELDAVNGELESFAYSVSHDLRAPLRGMVGFCEALAEDYGEKLDDTAKDYLKRIIAASKRMGRLIDDLLALSRVTRTEIEHADVDLSAMAESIARQLQAAEPDRRVEFKIQPGMTATGDEILLRTALENLLGNAWKYSGKSAEAVIEFGIALNGGEPTYYVRDNGVGFDMAHADKIFQPFQRLHRDEEFEGTGIGLASVANILRRHGGRIWAESQPNVGTTMQFTI